MSVCVSVCECECVCECVCVSECMLREPLPLTIHHYPVSTTFVLFEVGVCVNVCVCMCV